MDSCNYKGNWFRIESERDFWYRSAPRYRITDMEIDSDEVWLPETVDGIPVHAWEIRKEIGVFPGVRIFHIPKTVDRISIRNDIFPNLERVEIDPDNPAYDTDGRMIMAYDTMARSSRRKSVAYCPVCRGDELRIPDDIREIRNYAFSGTKYRRIVFPKADLEIGSKAFAGSAWIEEQEDPIVIGHLLYRMKEGTEYLEVPDQVRRIAPEILDSGCIREMATPFLPGRALITRLNERGSLRSLMITSVRADLNIRLLRLLETLEEVSIAEGHPRYRTIDGVVFTADEKSLVYYPPFRKVACYVIPDGVCKIEESAFANQRYLEELVMPESVCQIGPSAFMGCRLLRYVRMSSQIRELPDSCPYQKGGVFERCESLKELELPEQMTYLGSYAFYESGLVRIGMGSRLQMIGEYALMAKGLIRVRLPDSMQRLGKGSLFYVVHAEVYEGSAHGLVSAFNASWPKEKDDLANLCWERREITVLHRDSNSREQFMIPKHLARSAAYHLDMAWNNDRIDYAEYDACLGEIDDAREKVEFAQSIIAHCKPDEANDVADYLRRVSYKIAAGLLKKHQEEEFLHFLKMDYLSAASLAKLVKLSNREGMTVCTAYLLEKQTNIEH